MFDILKQAVKRAGARKFLFGSDGPWLHPGVELAKIYALHLPVKEQQLILSGNFLRLISQVQHQPTAIRQTALTPSGVPPVAFRDPWLIGQDSFSV